MDNYKELPGEFYNNPDIIILDESTSSLDDITEKNIVKIITNCQKLNNYIYIT